MDDPKTQELVNELKKRMGSVEVLPDEPDFFSSDETLLRYLKAREWDINEAEKQLKSTVEWRRTIKPLSLDCRWCHERPGYHSMRQIGFDELGRPVIYSCFAQAAVKKLSAEDSIAHVTYLIENAKVTMPSGSPSWVFVFDCTGMTLPSCNPKLGYSVTQVMSTHYPERLGLAICVNHSRVFQGIWNAIKVFLHPNTAAKMTLVRGKKKVRETFDQYFSEELRDWILAEMKLNKQEPLPHGQLAFWEKPKNACDHDPRGCPSYVSKYIDPLSADDPDTTTPNEQGATCIRTHKPHPNILDELHNRVAAILPRSPNPMHSKSNNIGNNSHETDSNSSDAGLSDFEELEISEISEEYKIPENSQCLPGLANTSPDKKAEKNKTKKGSNRFFLAI